MGPRRVPVSNWPDILDVILDVIHSKGEDFIRKRIVQGVGLSWGVICQRYFITNKSDYWCEHIYSTYISQVFHTNNSRLVPASGLSNQTRHLPLPWPRSLPSGDSSPTKVLTPTSDAGLSWLFLAWPPTWLQPLPPPLFHRWLDSEIKKNMDG